VDAAKEVAINSAAKAAAASKADALANTFKHSSKHSQTLSNTPRKHSPALSHTPETDALATVAAGHDDCPDERRVNPRRDHINRVGDRALSQRHEFNCAERFTDDVDNAERDSGHKQGRLYGNKEEHC